MCVEFGQNGSLGKSQQRALFFGKCPVGRAFGQKIAKSGRSRKMGVKLYRWEAGAKSSTIGDKGLIFGTEVARARKSGLLYTTLRHTVSYRHRISP